MVDVYYGHNQWLGLAKRTQSPSRWPRRQPADARHEGDRRFCFGAQRGLRSGPPTLVDYIERAAEVTSR